MWYWFMTWAGWGEVGEQACWGRGQGWIVKEGRQTLEREPSFVEQMSGWLAGCLGGEELGPGQDVEGGEGRDKEPKLPCLQKPERCPDCWGRTQRWREGGPARHGDTGPEGKNRAGRGAWAGGRGGTKGFFFLKKRGASY